jgi:hypothetical protein
MRTYMYISRKKDSKASLIYFVRLEDQPVFRKQSLALDKQKPLNELV